MIEYAKVTNNNDESLVLELRSPEKSGFFVRGIDGLGPTKADINLSQALTVPGSLFNSSRTNHRNIVFRLGLYDGPGASVETARQQSYRFFPVGEPIAIEVKTDNRLGLTLGYVESNEPNIFSNNEETIVSVVCPNAYFVGKDYIQTVFSGVSGGFQFPLENLSLTEQLITFGNVFINTESNLFYTGDVSTGVVIYVKVLGAVNDLTIINISNGQTMAISSAKIIALTGQNLVAGDSLLISTNPGEKYIYLIRGGNTINILNSLSSGADWFVINRGDNVFTYTAQSGLSNLQFLIEHRPVYGGL